MTPPAPPERVRRALAERARLLAESGTDGAMDAAEEILAFNISGHHYGVPLANAVRALRISRLTAIPSAPQFVVGIVSVGNVLVTLVDLVVMLGLPKQRGGDLSGAVVVTDGARHVALAAEELQGIEQVPQSCLAALPRDHLPFSRAAALRGGTASVLDVAALVAHPLLNP